MSIASHAVNRLRNMWKTIYRRNARLNAESFGYSRHHSAATAPLLEQLEPRVLLSAAPAEAPQLVTLPQMEVTLEAASVSESDTRYGQVDVLRYAITDGEVTIRYCDTAARGAVVIPSTIEGLPVTSIGGSAFARCSGLTSVTIPDSVTSIGGSAFLSCTHLSSVSIPEGVTSIGSMTFSYCAGLTSVTIPDSVSSIGGWAFSGCSALTSVTIPDSVTSIGTSTFSGCSALTSVTIPDGVTSIGNYAFRKCSGLTSVTMPNSVTSIGREAFDDCSGLTSVTIPDGVTSIGRNAFARCSGLTSVTIPGGVTSIGDYVFYECSGLTSVTIPDGVTAIGDWAFSGCRGLTSVTIPDGVTSIGRNAFRNCGRLASVTIPDGVTSISERAFYGCSGLASMMIPDGVTSIGDYAFANCRGLASVTIPDGVTSIGDRAFISCASLTNVTFEGDAPSSFGAAVFNFAADGFMVSYYDDATGFTSPTWNSYNTVIIGISMLTYDITNGEVTITDCDSAYTGAVSIPSTIERLPVTAIGDWAFSGCSGLTSVTIPDGVTSIGSDAFSGCSGLASVSIPSSVSSIRSDTFSGCSGLTSVMIPSSVTSIGDRAFYACSGLTSVTIPDGLTSIGDMAFYYCSGLTSMTIPHAVTSIGAGAFGSCSDLTSVMVIGDAPILGTEVFSEDASHLVIYYHVEAAGFNESIWNVYRTEYFPDFPVRLTVAEKWTYQFVDANGDLVTVKLSGATDATTMALHFDSDSSVPGFAGDVREIKLTGTGPKTQLSISVKANKLAGDGTTTVEEISVTDGALKAIKAKTTDLVGTGLVANAGGYVGSIDIRNLTDGADIILPGEGAVKGVSIKAGQFEDGTDVTLGSPLKSLAMAAWGDGELTAPWATSIAIKGNKKLGIAADFGVDITLTGADAKGISLGKFAAAGTATGEIRTRGNIGSVTIASVNGFDLLVGIDPDAGRFPAVAEDFDNLRGSIKSVKISGIKGQTGTFFQDSNIAAASIGSVSLVNADFDIGTSGIYARYYQGMGTPIKKVSYANKALGEKWSWPIKKGVSNEPEDFIHCLFQPQGTISIPIGPGV